MFGKQCSIFTTLVKLYFYHLFFFGETIFIHFDVYNYTAKLYTNINERSILLLLYLL